MHLIKITKKEAWADDLRCNDGKCQRFAEWAIWTGKRRNNDKENLVAMICNFHWLRFLRQNVWKFYQQSIDKAVPKRKQTLKD